MITPTHYMILSAALFIIGVVGVMVRRNIIIIFMSIELILNAVNINLVAFSYKLQNGIGQVFAIFVIAVAAAEARSEEHTSELQSRRDLVCRLLLEKKNKSNNVTYTPRSHAH